MVDYEELLKGLDDRDYDRLARVFCLARAQGKNDLAVRIAMKLHNNEVWAELPKYKRSAFLWEYGQALEVVGNRELAKSLYRSILRATDNEPYREMARERIGML